VPLGEYLPASTGRKRLLLAILTAIELLYVPHCLAGMLIHVECENGSYDKMVGGTLSSKVQSYYCPATDKIVTRWVVIGKPW
jgi:hypothetical protein